LHIGLAAPMFCSAFPIFCQFTAHSSHGFVDGFKQRFTTTALMATLFDQSVPPALAVFKAGSMGQPVQRIAVLGFGAQFMHGSIGALCINSFCGIHQQCIALFLGLFLGLRIAITFLCLGFF